MSIHSVHSFPFFSGLLYQCFWDCWMYPPFVSYIFVASNGGYSAQQQGKTCSRRSCEPPPSAWRRASVETPQVRRAGRKWRALEKSFVWVNGDIIRDIYIYIYTIIIYFYLCLYVCMRGICVYIYVCVCIYISVNVRMYINMNVCGDDDDDYVKMPARCWFFSELRLAIEMIENGFGGFPFKHGNHGREEWPGDPIQR